MWKRNIYLEQYLLGTWSPRLTHGTTINFTQLIKFFMSLHQTPWVLDNIIFHDHRFVKHKYRSYLVGTGTSVSAPSMTACCSLTKATKGASRKSTSPTSTLEASASLGNFFINLFFSWTDRRGGNLMNPANTRGKRRGPDKECALLFYMPNRDINGGRCIIYILWQVSICPKEAAVQQVPSLTLACH